MISKRFAAFIIDLLIIAFICSLMYFLTQTHKSQILLQINSAIMITLLLCKDCINGQSIGKRIMKLQVIDKSADNKVSNLSLIVRNIFLVFWIVEVLVLLISREKRLGDFVAKTKVISNCNLEKVQIDKKILFTFLLCFCVIFVFLFLVYNFFRSSTLQLLLR